MNKNNNYYPLVSVVIPTYNHGHLISEAITSVLNQSYKNFEIIIIDNYSQDNTEEVVKSFKDKKINYIKFNNKGIIAASRNIGIKNTKGELVAFLDSDDVWYKDKLKYSIKAFQKNADIILSCHNEYCVRNNKIIKKYNYGPYTENMYYSLLFKKNCVSTSAVVAKKDVLIKTGGFLEDEKFIGCEDYEYWMRLSKEGKFYFINKVLGEYRIHGTNIISNPIKLANNVFNVLELHYNKLSKNEQKKNKKKFALRKARVFASCTKSLFYNKDIKTIFWGFNSLKEILKIIYL